MPSIHVSSAAMLSLAGRGGAACACGPDGLAHSAVELVLARVLRDAKRRRARQRDRRGRNRMLVGAGGEDGDVAVLLDAHRKFGADQIEAFGAHMTAEQAQAGDADFRFRRARDHGAVGIAHDDVADAHRGAAVLGALDLGAADFDAFAAAEILLDGGNEPRGEGVELDRAAGEPPPQSAEPENQHADEDAGADPDAPDQPPMPGQKAPISGQIAAVAPTLAAMSRREAAPASRMNGRFPSRDGRALPILVRHARSGVPSSVASSQVYSREQ